MVRHRLGDAPIALHLRKVARAAEKAVGHAGRAPAAAGDLVGALLRGIHLQDTRRAFHDALQQIGRIIVVPKVDAKAGSQRRCEQAFPGGGPYEGERRQGDLHAPRVGPGVDHDVDVVVLHRRVEVFFHHRAEPVNLVDEEHIAFLQVGEHTRNVGGLLEHWSARGGDLGAHLLRNDVREGRLAQSGRPREQHMVQRLAALQRRRHEHLQVALDLLLPNEVIQRLGPQQLFEVFLRGGRGQRANGVGTVGHTRGDERDEGR